MQSGATSKIESRDCILMGEATVKKTKPQNSDANSNYEKADNQDHR